jgi:hypothetical protein
MDDREHHTSRSGPAEAHADMRFADKTRRMTCHARNRVDG